MEDMEPCSGSLGYSDLEVLLAPPRAAAIIMNVPPDIIQEIGTRIEEPCHVAAPVFALRAWQYAMSDGKGCWEFKLELPDTR